MQDKTIKPGDATIVQPGESKSYWQPVPANGFVQCILNSKTVTSNAEFSMGTQTVAPGCRVREHSHDQHEEVIFFLSGEGVVTLDGEEAPAV